MWNFAKKKFITIIYLYNINQLCFPFFGYDDIIHSMDCSFRCSYIVWQIQLRLSILWNKYILLLFFLNGSNIGGSIIVSSVVTGNISFTNSKSVSPPAVIRTLQRILFNSSDLIFRSFVQWVLSSFDLIKYFRLICFKRYLGTRIPLKKWRRKTKAKKA